jgi:hypothetical protein
VNDPKENLAKRIVEFLDQYGIDTFYAVTALAIILVISYRKDIKKWDKLEGWRKSIIGSTIFAAVIFSIISLLRLTGIIDL